jgi:hypothetical protein
VFDADLTAFGAQSPQLATRYAIADEVSATETSNQ